LFVYYGIVDGVLGEGKYRMLSAIDEYGPIRKAAVSLGRSYRKALGRR
jgi:molybdenum-dependent DNA-binding transcriptional regulator ModE